MQETSLPEDSVGLVAGRLEGMSVPDLMWLLCRRRGTGVLHLSRRGVAKRVFFQNGRIVFAASSDPNDRLGEMLLREGIIDLEQFEDAVSKLCLGKRLGTLLVETGHLRPEDLVRGVIAQVREIVLEPFTWEEGSYRFDEGPLPTQEVVTLGMMTGEILLQGIRRIRSFTRIRRSVGGPRQRFALAPGTAEVVEGLALTDGERLVLKRLQRGSASIEALCREIYASNFEVHQALWAFRVLGLVTEADGAEEATSAGASLEGRLGPEGIVDVLVKLCRASETGVLYATRGSLERTFHLREGRCVFATSNSIDDGLVAHLLRRGVISIQDREETARRLLSNKRVGTILLEMGVLDEHDLREMVREQLTEVACDTFRWEDGEFTFVPGKLPTVEDIVLEMSIEDLVSEGIRRVASWSRVRAGCGGSSKTLLALTPDYLHVLDRMKVGADEWEVVSCLGAPKAAIEICRRVSLPDFRVCQIVWALRLLGAVREVPASEASELAREPGPVDRPSETEPASDLAAVPADEPRFPGAPEEARTAEPESIPVAPQQEGPAEFVSEIWRLTAEPFGAPPREETPPAPMEPASGDSTAVISRGEVEAALGLSPPARDEHEFELAEPGAGTDAPVAGSGSEDAAGGRDFEIGKPVPEPQEPVAAPSGEPEPSFELADEPGRREADVPGEETPAPEGPPAEQTNAIPAEEVARAIGSVAEEAVAPTEPPSEPQEPGREASCSESEPADPATLAVAPDEVSQTAPDPAGPIVELDRAILRFNRLHRLLYRAIRSEVGAGTANFIHACRGRLDEDHGELFAESRLLPDGSWDPEGLKKILRERRVGEPWPGLQGLLDREFEMLRPQIDEGRVKALHDQLSEIRRSS